MVQSLTYVDHLNLQSALQSWLPLKYSQTPLLRTPLGPEKVSIIQSVLIKRVDFKENVWSRIKKTVRNNECPY